MLQAARYAVFIATAVQPILLAELASAQREAVAVIDVGSSASGVSGRVNFEETADCGVLIRGYLTGLRPNSLHGMHIHTDGNVTAGCISTGAHWNPTNKSHGAPTSNDSHAGDLGNVQTDATGVANFSLTSPVLSLLGVASILGRALVVHNETDDLGLGNNSASLVNGNSGARLACGIIVWVNSSMVSSGPHCGTPTSAPLPSSTGTPPPSSSVTVPAVGSDGATSALPPPNSPETSTAGPGASTSAGPLNSSGTSPAGSSASLISTVTLLVGSSTATSDPQLNSSRTWPAESSPTSTEQATSGTSAAVNSPLSNATLPSISAGSSSGGASTTGAAAGSSPRDATTSLPSISAGSSSGGASTTGAATGSSPRDATTSLPSISAGSSSGGASTTGAATESPPQSATISMSNISTSQSIFAATNATGFPATVNPQPTALATTARGNGARKSGDSLRLLSFVAVALPIFLASV